MKEEIKYKVGDRVYAPFHGYGVVTEIKDDGREYPITVTWDEKKHGCSASIFTPDGSAFKGLDSDDDDITLVEKASPKKDEKEGKFKVGDRVRSLEFGVGVVDEVIASEHTYPITVKWTEGSLGDGTYSSFTSEGHYYNHRSDAEKDITLLEGGEKEMEECINFKAGDRVSYPYHGLGTVIANHNDGRLYPIDVKWDKSPKGYEVSTFTKDGFLVVSLGDCGDNDKLIVVEPKLPKDAEDTEEAEAECNGLKVGDRVWLSSIERGTIVRFCPNEETCFVNSELDGEVEVRVDALEKIEDSAINPAHYQVEGIPEAIEIMKHLMTKEQMEGFLWGNILKYAYRYGRKGDKKETAGKIEWYAKHLKDIDAEGEQK
nr:MAG TPA: nucelotide kinase [Caudoviricetes sp.]